MRSLLIALLLVGCTGPSDDDAPKDTADADADTDADTDRDRDGDTYPASTDCDDSRADVNPGVALDVCNGRDDNCDGTIDEDPDLAWYPDTDGDGFGDPSQSAVITCDPGSLDFATNGSDCDDTDPNTYPAADEPCDGVDNDCNGVIDNGADQATWYMDRDGDGYGDADAVGELTCDPGAGTFATNNGDCDDDQAAVSPGATERCDEVDNDCNGEVDENEAVWDAFYEDADADGAGTDVLVYGCTAESAGGATNNWDCDDRDGTEPVFVAVAGSSRGTGRVDSPVDTIQTGIGQSDTCVKVAAGNYHEDLDFLGRDITVESLDGSAATTITGFGRAPVVTFQYGESSAAVLQGFTITGGTGLSTYTSSSYTSGDIYYYNYNYDYVGGGVYISGSTPTLVDLVIAGNVLPESSSSSADYGSEVYNFNYSSSGGGLFVNSGAVTLEDVSIQENYAYSGGALQSSNSDVVGTRVDMSGNDSHYPTVWHESGTMSLDSFIFNANASDFGYAMIYTTGGKLEIRNAALLSGNYAIYNGGSKVTLSSSVVSGNDVGIYDSSGGSYTWNLTYNNVYGNGTDWSYVTDPTGTDGNLYVNPGFTDWIDDTDYASDDLTLGSRSILVNAGDPDPTRNDVDGSVNDMGVYGGPEGSGW